ARAFRRRSLSLGAAPRRTARPGDDPLQRCARLLGRGSDPRTASEDTTSRGRRSPRKDPHRHRCAWLRSRRSRSARGRGAFGRFPADRNARRVRVSGAPEPRARIWIYLYAAFAVPFIYGASFPAGRLAWIGWIGFAPWFVAIRIAPARTAILLCCISTLLG